MKWLKIWYNKVWNLIKAKCGASGAHRRRGPSAARSGGSRLLDEAANRLTDRLQAQRAVARDSIARGIFFPIFYNLKTKIIKLNFKKKNNK